MLKYRFLSRHTMCALCAVLVVAARTHDDENVSSFQVKMKNVEKKVKKMGRTERERRSTVVQ